MEDGQAGTDEITRLHDVAERRSLSGRDLLLWAATLLAFPLAGLAGRAIAGPVDATWTAFLAGAVAGLVHALVLRGSATSRRDLLREATA